LKKIKDYASIWKKWEALILWGNFVLLNLMNLMLIFRSSPFMLSLGLLKRLFVGASSLAIPLVYVLFLVLTALFVREKDFFSGLGKRIFIVSVLFIAILVIGSLFYFNFQDLMHFQNYTFSKFYIYLPSLSFFAYFLILVFVVGFISYLEANFKRLRMVFTLTNISSFIIVSFLPLILFSIILDIPPQLKDELIIYHTYILSRNKDQNPDFPSLKKELDFIKSVTSMTSAIIHPTQSNEFPLLGNEPLIRHDLYPRELVSSKFADDFIKTTKRQDVYYILSVYEDRATKKITIFPDYKIDASEILILYFDGHMDRMNNMVYSPDMISKLGNFDIGLIKIK